MYFNVNCTSVPFPSVLERAIPQPASPFSMARMWTF